MPNTPNGFGSSIEAILGQVTGLAARLVQTEARLARLEIREAAPKTGRAVARAAIGAAAILYGIGFLTTALYLGISQVVRPWLAALIVGGVFSISGGVVAWKAVQYLKRVGLPVRLRPKRSQAG